jgi:hypothetical protein
MKVVDMSVGLKTFTMAALAPLRFSTPDSATTMAAL